MFRKTFRRFAAVMFALALVTSVSFGGISGVNSPVGTAEAKHNCGITDSIVTGMSLFWLNHEKCLTEHVADEKNQTSIDIYSNALGIRDQSDVFLTQQDNFQTDSRSVAWSKAKMTIVNELNNGSSASTTKVAANRTVTNYYYTMQVNVLKQWNASVHQMEYLYGQNNSQIKMYRGNDAETSTQELTIAGFADVEVKLLNGSTAWIRAPVISGTNQLAKVPYKSTGMTKNATTTVDGVDSTYDSLGVKKPDSSYEDKIVLDRSRYNNTLEGLASQEQQIRSNIDLYVENVYTEYSSGQLNLSQIMDPEDLAAQASTDYNSTGYYGFAAVQLASMGLEGQMNTSMTLYFEQDDYSQDGFLFYGADDIDTFKTNTTYDPTNYNGTFWFAWQEGNKSGIRKINQNFTVEEIRNVNPNSTHYGETMNNTTIEHYTYQTHNASNLSHQLEQLEELRKEYEDQQTTSSGGGGSDEGKWPFTPTETAAGAGVLAAVSYFLRSGAA